MTGGAVLAGGRSTRFGSDKAVASLPSGELLVHKPIAALREAGLDPVVIVGGAASLGAATSTVVIEDQWPGEGPLGGVLSALRWFSSLEAVVVLPCDLPIITSEGVGAMLDRWSGQPTGVAVVASDDGELNPSIGIWPTDWTPLLSSRFRSGERRLRTMLELGPVVGVELGSQIHDADTPSALSRLTEEFD